MMMLPPSPAPSGRRPSSGRSRIDLPGGRMTVPTASAGPAPAVAGPDPAVARPGAACACGPTRRQVLRGTGAVAGALAGAGVLAACAERRLTPQEAAASASAVGPGTVVVALADVPVGGAVAATVGGHDVLVTQPAAGEVHA